jgi:hypothetical protein
MEDTFFTLLSILKDGVQHSGQKNWHCQGKNLSGVS